MKQRIGIFIIILLCCINISTFGLNNNMKSQLLEHNSENDMNLFIVKLINQVNETMLFNYTRGLVEIGPRYTGSDNCKRAAEYIHEEFTKMGLWVQYEDWSFRGFNSTNVVATLNGTDRSINTIIVLCAHYDTICNKNGTVYDGPGATDNAVGVATVLTTAKIMSKYAFNHTIRFIAFSGEENGMLGSYQNAIKAYGMDDNILAVINVDENGYAARDHENLIISQTAKIGDWLSIESNIICAQYKTMINISIIDEAYYSGSDHSPFYNFGFDFVFFRSYDWDTPWMHSPYDTLDKISKTYHAKTTKLILAILADLALKHIEIQVMIKNPFEGFVYLYENPIFYVEPWSKHGSSIYVVPTILLGSSTIRAHVISKEEIEGVSFCIDEGLMSYDTTPPYEWKTHGWHFSFFKYPIIGTHQLTVLAYTSSGKIARDDMDITIFVL